MSEVIRWCALSGSLVDLGRFLPLEGTKKTKIHLRNRHYRQCDQGDGLQSHAIKESKAWAGGGLTRDRRGSVIRRWGLGSLQPGGWALAWVRRCWAWVASAWRLSATVLALGRFSLVVGRWLGCDGAGLGSLQSGGWAVAWGATVLGLGRFSPAADLRPGGRRRPRAAAAGGGVGRPCGCPAPARRIADGFDLFRHQAVGAVAGAGGHRGVGPQGR